MDCNSRSLPSGKALEENLGIAIDEQIVDGLRVGRGAVGAFGELAQRSRAHVTEGLLHLGQDERLFAVKGKRGRLDGRRTSRSHSVG